MIEKKAHAKYGASKSERWLACAGSIALEEKAPPEAPSPYAEEGTRAHEVVEFLLKNHDKPLNKLHAELKKKGYDEAMRQHGTDAVMHIMKITPKGAIRLCETKVDASHFTMPGQFGTVDCAIVEEFGRLTVIDYKYGAGIAVDPEENPQLIYYALGIAKEYHWNFAEIEIMVIQPRAHHERGPYRSWVTTPSELIKWEKTFRDGVKAAEKKDAPLKAGDHCRWCRAKTICPEISSKAIASAKAAFTTNELTMVPTELAPIEVQLEMAYRLEHWIGAVKERAVLLLKTGKLVPGYKLVATQARRKWASEAEASSELHRRFGPEVFEPRALRSPAQIEEVLSKSYEPKAIKAMVKKFAVSISSGTTIAPEKDRRPAVDPIKDVFKASPKKGK